MANWQVFIEISLSSKGFKDNTGVAQRMPLFGEVFLVERLGVQNW